MKKNRNIVSFDRDIKFYLKRAFRYMDIGNIKRALDYFNIASTIEPRNILVQFNRAGIMAEIGELRESNRILKNIVEKLDATMGECFFGIGCNYFQMENMEEAKKYFKKYVEKYPKGEFAEEAEELIEIIEEIFYESSTEKLIDPVYEEIRIMLDKGQIKRAKNKIEKKLQEGCQSVKLKNLEVMVNIHKKDYKKAIDLTNEILNLEKDNVEAQCNLMIIHNKMGNLKEQRSIADIIAAKEYDSIEHLYKISLAFGQIGSHYYCYIIYKEILKLFSENLLFLHFAALSLYNQRLFKAASGYWNIILDIDTGNLIAQKYIQLLKDLKSNPNSFEEEKYAYQLPKRYKEAYNQRLKELTCYNNQELRVLWQRDEEIRQLIMWALRQNQRRELEYCLDILEKIADDECLIILEDFVIWYNKRDLIKTRAKAVLANLRKSDAKIISLEGHGIEN